MRGRAATPEMVAKLLSPLDLDQPLAVRYVRYVGRVLRGDLGRSIREGRQVNDEIADVWPATAALGATALVLAIAVGVPAGIISARWPFSLFDNIARVVTLLGLSMPIFWTGIVLIVIFSLWLGWLPAGGRGTWLHLVLPAVALASPSVAVLARMTRSTMLEVLREDYVRTARAEGVALRGLLVP